MTDYLEEAGAEDEEALWELERQLAALLAGGAARKAVWAEERTPGERSPEAADLAGTKAAPQTGQTGDRRGRSGAERAGETPPAGPEEREAEPEEGEGARPLLDQFRALERAAARVARADPEPGLSRGGRAVEPAAPRTAGRGGAISGGEPAGALWRDTAGAEGPGGAETLPWLERADRAFRRDSRRYDGGFYLY